MSTLIYEPTNKEKVFLHYHDILRNQLTDANGHWAIYKYLIDSIGDYSREMEIARAFFGLTIQGHFYVTIMRLNIFFDKSGDHISIYKLMKFISQNRDMFSNEAFARRVDGCTTYDMVMEQHKEIDRQLVNCDKRKLRGLPIDNLRQCRNRALAHIDEEHALTGISVFKQFPVTREQIDEIIDILDKILNRYSVAYDAVFYGKNLLLERGIKEVLDSIRFRGQA